MTKRFILFLLLALISINGNAVDVPDVVKTFYETMIHFGEAANVSQAIGYRNSLMDYEGSL